MLQPPLEDSQLLGPSALGSYAELRQSNLARNHSDKSSHDKVLVCNHLQTPFRCFDPDSSVVCSLGLTIERRLGNPEIRDWALEPSLLYCPFWQFCARLLVSISTPSGADRGFAAENKELMRSRAKV
jgi:hypothetical protein